jgi:nitrogenase molybdenum-iron protein alpha/beta subunit
VKIAVDRVVARKDCGVVLLTALPCCRITGMDYGRILNAHAAVWPKPVLPVSFNSFDGDWLDGYSEVLATLARAVDLSHAKPTPGTVAIVGYMLDRTEPEHQANLRELRNLLAGLELELGSVWLNNTSFRCLSDIKNAQVIISFPYGREAARILAKRLRIRLIEVDLPLGVRGTEAWVESVARFCGRQKQAARLLDRELPIVLKALKWIAPQVFLHRRVAFAGDPYLLSGFRRLAEELGCQFAGGAVLGRREHWKSLASPPAVGPAGILFDPERSEWEAALTRMGPLDLLVVNSLARTRQPVSRAVMEFGFPSFAHHSLVQQPFLGFQGCLGLVERMSNALIAHEIHLPVRDAA